jgi:signal transduction histidine kinase
MIQADLIPDTLLINGPFGITWLRPLHLFGFGEFNSIPHSTFWSLLTNLGLYIGISLLSRPSALEYSQATLFVDVFKHSKDAYYFKTTAASVIDLRSLLVRFIGEQNADKALTSYAREHNIDWVEALEAETDLVNYAEKLLAGAIGSALARVMMDSIAKKEPLSSEEIMEMLDETQQAIAYSKELEIKSTELEKATTELKQANEKLKELDQLKNDFVSTVTHELRTPLTSIRALAEILNSNPMLEEQKQSEFTEIIIKEAQRLSRLINQVLDIQKFDSQKTVLQLQPTDIKKVTNDAIDATRQLIDGKHIALKVEADEDIPLVMMDRDRIIQVVINLLSNAVKFCESENGFIQINLTEEKDFLKVEVKDNGIGIKQRDKQLIFERFSQVRRQTGGAQSGSGLGLPICKHIIESHQGEIWVESKPKKGSAFIFTLPKHRKGKEIERIDYVIM